MLVICDNEAAHRDLIAGLPEPLGFEMPIVRDQLIARMAGRAAFSLDASVVLAHSSSGTGCS